MRWILILLLVLHALIHLLGFSLAWGGTVAATTGDTLIRLGGLGLRVAGVAWLLTCLLLLVAALAMALGQDWWRAVAIGAAVASQVLIVLWWADARAGTPANLLILAAALWRPTMAARRVDAQP
jgi:hypothetical protein